MKADFINPFVTAMYFVLEKETGITPVKGELKVEESAYTTEDITVMLGVVGQVQGAVMYGMSERTVKNLVSALSGEPVPILDANAESAVAELGNVITGRASAGLEQVGYRCKLTPPSVVIGRGTIISTISIKRLLLPFDTEFGEIKCSIALRETGV